MASSLPPFGRFAHDTPGTLARSFEGGLESSELTLPFIGPDGGFVAMQQVVQT